MAQLFPPSANAWARATIAAAVVTAGTALAMLYSMGNSSYFTRQKEARHQPISFSHRHHVESMGIECRYCHVHAEESPFAGIPPTHTCMTCHSQVWSKSPYLEQVRSSYAEEEPIRWVRVHDLADFVYFNHSIHLKKGIGCENCHGRVDKMAAVYKEHNLTMGFCLNCHRNPEKYIRPRSEITTMGWKPPKGVDREQYGRELVEEYDAHPQDNCYTCHR